MTTAGVTYPAHVRTENLTSVSACIPTLFHSGTPCSRHREGFRCKGILDSAYWEARQRVFPHRSPGAWSRTQLKQPEAARRQETSRAGIARHRGGERDLWAWYGGVSRFLRHGGTGGGRSAAGYLCSVLCSVHGPGGVLG